VVEPGEACDDGAQVSGDGCSSKCAWETSCETDNARKPIACGGMVSGDFYGKYGDVNGQCGFDQPYSQDQVLVFAATADAHVTVKFTASPDQTDMAMFVLRGSCHAKLCSADSRLGDRHTASFDAVAGTTYYVVIEAPSNQPSYTATLTCD
jgi:cysteine-rich repeat protein